MSTLQIIWFFLIGILLTGYAVLDGFDLGVGFWSFFAKKEWDKKALMKSIGPLWDGNEVWLLTGGGAIFAAFPDVYATVFSGFYLALILVLVALIFRAVSFEFRKHESSSPWWREGWDMAFSLGSTLPALLFGVALGNVLRGVPLDASKNFTGTFFTLLNPYALVIGLLGFAMIATQGAIYIVMKAPPELAVRAKSWVNIAWLAYIVLFIIAGIAGAVFAPTTFDNFLAHPVLWAIPAFALAMIILIRGSINRELWGRAFLFSSLSVVGLMGIAGASLFPKMVPALGAPELSLTISNASSSELTLKVMLIMALIGMPVVVAYTIWMYRTFKGKVELNEESY